MLVLNFGIEGIELISRENSRKLVGVTSRNCDRDMKNRSFMKSGHKTESKEVGLDIETPITIVVFPCKQRNLAQGRFFLGLRHGIAARELDKFLCWYEVIQGQEARLITC